MTWHISNSEEGYYYGDYSSREDAIASGHEEFSGDDFWIGEACPPKPLSHGVFASEIIERATECLGQDDETWEEFNPAKEQLTELQSRIRGVIDEWVEASGLAPTWFLIQNADGIEGIGDDD
jgi:hypothetical protein